jgi:hypothetical protein
LLGLTLEDFFDQVVDDVAVIAREGADEPGNVVPPLHRERRELEASDPAFGPRLEGYDVLCREMQAHDLVEERGGLVGGERQLGGAQRGQLTAQAQAAERQWRIGATSEEEVQLRRQMVEEKSEALVDWLRRDQVVVVEHQHDGLREDADFIEQCAQQRLDWQRLTRMQQRERALADLGPHCLERGDDVGSEERGLIVALIKCDPCRMPFTRPGQLPAIQPAGSSCRSQPARRRGSACPRSPDSIVRSISGATPDPGATSGYKAWSWSSGLVTTFCPGESTMGGVYGSLRSHTCRPSGEPHVSLGQTGVLPRPC